jgi:hypothetical protein
MAVYFVQIGKTGPIKIGTGDNVLDRIYAFFRVVPGKPNLLAVIPGGKDVERSWHERFAHLRYRGNAEQFRPAPDLLEAIGYPPLEGVDPDSVDYVETVYHQTGSHFRRVPIWLTPNTVLKLRAIAHYGGTSNSLKFLRRLLTRYADRKYPIVRAGMEARRKAHGRRLRARRRKKV